MSDSKSEENSTSSRELMQSFQIKLYVEMIEPTNQSLNYIECFREFDIKNLVIPKYGVNINYLSNQLKNYGFQLEGRAISYYSYDCQMYINCGIDPIHPDYHIPLEEIRFQNCLRFKCTSTGISLIHLVMSEEMNEAVNKMKELENTDTHEIDNQNKDTKQCRRTKERRIGYIIEKVSRWREYYNGVIQNGQIQRFTLEEAAQKVGISKKSLDDYLLQVRYGRKYGFNFNEHRNEKVGILRAFVKKNNNQKKKKQLKTEN